MIRIKDLFTKKVSIALFLAEAAREMVDKETSLVTLGSKEEDQLEKLEFKLYELGELGLQSSNNYQMIQEEIRRLKILRGNEKLKIDLLDYLKKIKTTFSGKSYLISREKFGELLKKYNLSVGLLQDYKGVIPDRNIQDLKEARKKLLEEDLGLNDFRVFVDKVIVNTDSLDNSIKKGIRKIVDDQCFRILTYRYTWSRNGRHDLEDFWEFKGTEFTGRRLKLETREVNRDTFLIACPEKYLKEIKVEVSKAPVDPIIFQVAPHGILIHTVWGEEAEDKVLEEYKKLKDLV